MRHNTESTPILLPLRYLRQMSTTFPLREIKTHKDPLFHLYKHYPNLFMNSPFWIMELKIMNTIVQGIIERALLLYAVWRVSTSTALSKNISQPPVKTTGIVPLIQSVWGIVFSIYNIILPGLWSQVHCWRSKIQWNQWDFTSKQAYWRRKCYICNVSHKTCSD